MEAVPRQQVLRRLRADNAWWDAPHIVPSPDAELPSRGYLGAFLALVKLLSVRRAVLLMGPRRVGKTVLLRHVVRQLLADGLAPAHVCYISVDHPLYHGLGLEHLFHSYREAAGIDEQVGPLYVLFDEIQHLRDWEVHLKALVDAYPHVRFVASGSAAAALKFKSRESGAGRFTDFLLPPLTFHEYVALRQRSAALFGDAHGSYRALAVPDVNEEFIRYLNFGGYPELALNPEVQRDPGRFVKEDVIDKVLLRDLPGLYGIQDIQELNSLFTMLAFNTGGEVSLEALAQRSHVAKNTLKRYIEYLEAAFLIKVVHRVDHNARRFQRAKAFKVFLTNPSMYAALFTPVDAGDDVTPRLVETAIFAQWFHSPQAAYYARWDGGEVDLVWLSALQKVAAAVEVKWSDRAFDNPGELKSLIAFSNRHDLEYPVATTRTMNGVKQVGGLSIAYIPASVYSYIVGNVLVSRRSDEVHEAVRQQAQDPGATAQSSLPL